MKATSVLLTFVICFALAGEAYAQRSLPGMRGIQLTGGMVDGFYNSGNNNESGYYFGAAMATYANYSNKWVLGAEYMQKYYPYRDTRIPLSQFTGEGGYYYNFLSDANKIFFFYLGGSVLAGYETSNRGEKILFDGSTLNAKDTFIYGGAISLELETCLTDRLILLLTGRERFLWGTSTGRFHTQFGIGFRYIIN
ncbi:conjugal transfer protein TraO [Bacteroidia bacterium]|nr:conjugal transfer protein TraO [Bacteroidia bacterium]